MSLSLHRRLAVCSKAAQIERLADQATLQINFAGKIHKPGTNFRNFRPNAPRPASPSISITPTTPHTGNSRWLFTPPHYGHYCFLPLLVFEAGKDALVTAVLRPGKRPTGAENSMIMKRVLGLLRQHWPQTHIVWRGNGHFANPELMELIIADGNADFIFGLGCNAVLSRRAEGLMRNARGQAENWIKQVKCDLKADRTSASSLHRQLRSSAVCGGSQRVAPAIAPMGFA